MLCSTSNVCRREGCLRVEARQIREAYIHAYSCMEKGFALLLHLKDFYARNVIRHANAPLTLNTHTREGDRIRKDSAAKALATPSRAWYGIVKYEISSCNIFAASPLLLLMPTWSDDSTLA